MRAIETIEKWKMAEAYLRKHGYRLHQTQYSWYDLSGFHAWFYCGEKDIEVVTHIEAVQRMIIAYNAQD